jgi:hypothetical protein
MSEKVIVGGPFTRTKNRAYHTDDDCPYVQRMDKPYRRRLDTLEGFHECWYCAGETPERSDTRITPEERVAAYRARQNNEQ